ncbi:MAG: hypothetical protein AAGL66_08605, partial [Pseudomonadota bacterium]
KPASGGRTLHERDRTIANAIEDTFPTRTKLLGREVGLVVLSVDRGRKHKNREQAANTNPMAAGHGSLLA